MPPQEQIDLLKDNGYTITKDFPLTLTNGKGAILTGVKAHLLIASLEFLRAANNRLDAGMSKINKK